jgi:hypothetical protein
LRFQISNPAARVVAALVPLLAPCLLRAAEPHWPNGFPNRPDFFPLCVWVQNPDNADRYKALGINTYVALYRGPTDQQLALLEKAGMYAVVQQSPRSLKFKDSAVIVAWMHGDEPDNAQPRRDGRPGWGPPVEPGKIVADYERIKVTDPTRPVLLNLGQGVAWDNWHGRGIRSRHPEDYPLYLKGCDIASFDIYPVTHDSPEVAGKLQYVGDGVRRLREWTNDAKPAWACIETTHIHNENALPTPQQVRSEVWMAVAHGAKGIVYFCHEFKPVQVEAGLLQHPEIADAVKLVNAEVTRLAPILNSPTIANAVVPETEANPAPIVALCKKSGDDVYAFTVSRTDTPQRVAFRLPGHASANVEVLGESRTLRVQDNQFEDNYAAYGVHLYRITPAR